MVDGDNKAEKRCYWDFFFKEIFLFSRELRGNYFCSVFQYTFQAIKFLNITKDDDFTSEPT